jgi:hypothetical protein
MELNRMSEARQMTYGERAIGQTFNPSRDPKVDEVKALFAQIIDLCNEARAATNFGEKSRLFEVAITEAQTAQMWAVKAITWAGP